MSHGPRGRAALDELLETEVLEVLELEPTDPELLLELLGRELPLEPMDPDLLLELLDPELPPVPDDPDAHANTTEHTTVIEASRTYFIELTPALTARAGRLDSGIDRTYRRNSRTAQPLTSDFCDFWHSP